MRELPQKLEALERVLEAEGSEGVIIFARTKAITLTVAESLEQHGYDVAVLNGDVPQNQRERTIERLRDGRVNVLVATDVAARGLDVDRIGLVINYDIPFDGEAYVHRIGRTGRAGRSGEAILFLTPRESRFLGGLERAVNQPIEPMEVPSNASINQNRLDRLRERLTPLTAATRPAPTRNGPCWPRSCNGSARSRAAVPSSWPWRPWNSALVASRSCSRVRSAGVSPAPAVTGSRARDRDRPGSGERRSLRDRSRSAAKTDRSEHGTVPHRGGLA